MKESTAQGLIPFVVVAAAVWLPLFPALVWGKSVLPWSDIWKLLRRAAGLSVAVGFPVMFALTVFFMRMNPNRMPRTELLTRCAGAALAFLPLYGALITTSVFQARHRADRARGAARPFAVRLLSGVVIFAANFLGTAFMLFILIAITDVYRDRH